MYSVGASVIVSDSVVLLSHRFEAFFLAASFQVWNFSDFFFVDSHGGRQQVCSFVSLREEGTRI